MVPTSRQGCSDFLSGCRSRGRDGFNLTASRVRDKKEGHNLRFSGCGECEQLWEAYENATFKRVRAENALDMAKASYSTPDMQRLERELEEASQALEKCYETFRQHEAMAHQVRSRRAEAGA
jgi:hypothetical protein